MRLNWSFTQSLHHNSLSKSPLVSQRGLLGAAILLVIGHGVFLYSTMTGYAWIVPGQIAIWIVTVPLLLIGFWDFRIALLLSIVATPIFHTPPIPHLFTQGLGDLFALTAVVSFLTRNGRQALQLVNGLKALLLLIPAATLASILLNLIDASEIQWGVIKYEIAELAGISLAVSYALLMASAVRCEKDFRILIVAVMISVAISIMEGLVSLDLISACMPDLKGTIMSSGGQVSAGFGNPNYYASWLLAVFPLSLYRLSSQQDSVFKRLISAIVLLVILLLLLLTVSRTALLTLLSILFLWGIMAQSWLNKTKALVILFTLATLFPAAWNYRFEKCSADSNRALVDYIYQTNTLTFMRQEVFYNLLSGKNTEPLREQVDSMELGRRHPTRMELLVFAYEAWQSSPLIGVGPGILSTIVRDRTGIGEPAHNVAATVLAEQGVLGLVVWLMFWAALFWRVWCSGWGRRSDGIRPRHPAYGKYLFLIFLSLSITSLFADQYRVIWLWQFVGLVLSPYFSADDCPSVTRGHKD